MANTTRGLGKGLGALLGDEALRTDTSGSLCLPISQIEPFAGQPRRRFDEDALQDLADSIREHGIIQPLTVRRLSSVTIRSSPANAAGVPRASPVSAKCPPSSSRRTTAR